MPENFSANPAHVEASGVVGPVSTTSSVPASADASRSVLPAEPAEPPAPETPTPPFPPVALAPLAPFEPPFPLETLPESPPLRRELIGWSTSHAATRTGKVAPRIHAADLKLGIAFLQKRLTQPFE